MKFGRFNFEEKIFYGAVENNKVYELEENFLLGQKKTGKEFDWDLIKILPNIECNQYFYNPKLVSPGNLIIWEWLC